MQQAIPRRRCLRVTGPLAPYFKPYAQHLVDRGYSQVSYLHKTFLISRFSSWLGNKRIQADKITREHVEAFLRYSARLRCPKPGDLAALSGVTRWLGEKRIIDAGLAAANPPSDIERILREYAASLAEERGLAASTVNNYVQVVGRFLTSFSSTGEFSLASLRERDITDYIRTKAPSGRTFAAAKNCVTSLRSFLRFARYRNYIQDNLAAAVPSVAGWSMASIPRAMPSECVRRLLSESKKWPTADGRRNRAILLLLARLGLRAREIVRLELQDIDWSQGSLKIRDKGRQERPMPLPHDVGEAIATYLKCGRPQSTSRRVFLTARAPFGDLGSHTAICQIVRRSLGRAGIKLSNHGAHQLRHALAVDMLRRGLSLMEIGQMLRHRSVDATRRYAKVDLDSLREVALPWPLQVT